MTAMLSYSCVVWYAMICVAAKVPAERAYWIDNRAQQILPAVEFPGPGAKALFSDFILDNDRSELLTRTPLQIWNLSEKTPRRALINPPRYVAAVAWSHDKQWIATVSTSGPGNVGGGYDVRLWNATTGELVRLVKHEDNQQPMAVAFSPNGSLLCWISGDWNVPPRDNAVTRLNIVSLGTGESISVEGARGATGGTLPGTVAVRNKGLFISSDNQNVYYNTMTWRLEAAPQLKLTKVRDYPISIMALSPDERRGWGMHYLYTIDPVRIRRTPGMYVIGMLTGGYGVTDAMKSREVALYEVELATGRILSRREFGAGHENPQWPNDRPVAMGAHHLAGRKPNGCSTCFTSASTSTRAERFCSEKEKSPQAQPWSQSQLQSLIEQGPVQYLKGLKELQALHSEAEKIEAIRSLHSYLEPNIDSLWYRQRLADGRPIGTGLIEGGCKTIVSNRLKLNSARWTPKHTEQMAALRCLDYSGLWSNFWSDRAA